MSRDQDSRRARGQRRDNGVRVIYEHDPRFTTPTKIYITGTDARRGRSKGGAR